MAGVRAGLNGVDETIFTNSLRETKESLTHPDGILRTEAINEGIAFAHEFMNIHNGVPPRFSDCLDHFENTDVFRNTYSQIEALVTLTPEEADINSVEDNHIIQGYTQHDVEWYEKQARISSGSEQEHWLKEAQWAKEHLNNFSDSMKEHIPKHGHDMPNEISFKGYSESEIKSKIANAEAKIRYAQSQIRSHSELLKNSDFPETEKMHINHAERDLAAAKAELNKWKYTKPSK